MNHLQNQTSPYLLQHINNPVDWYPWGDEAIQRARQENKPIFLSIGYAACHWCHVMAHESFENPWIAEQLNRDYISIKVDREERPDLDQIYMTAAIALTGQGGWPLSVFLTPELKPFYGGTYFPPTARYGLPSFGELLNKISLVWQTQQEQILRSAENLSLQIQEHFSHPPSDVSPSISRSSILKLAQEMTSTYDWIHGGWGSAPKFPAPMTLDFLLQAGLHGKPQLTHAALHCLNALSMGGIFDLVEGGFHRYSTDKTWTVPHFEKMLSDNAQLASSFVHAYQVTGNLFFRLIAEKTLDYILDQLTSPEGGFYSSQDADSEGKEGTYYLWSPSDLDASTQSLLDKYAAWFDLPTNGHLENQMLLKIAPQQKSDSVSYDTWIPYPLSDLQIILDRLSILRNSRSKPHTDDKIILSWNALTLRAFVEAGLVFRRKDYLLAAKRNAEFLTNNLYHDGFLHHTWRTGQGNQIGFLEDYAGFSIALLSLYQADPQSKWLFLAQELIQKMLSEFDANDTFLYNNRKDQEHLISPVLDLQDMVIPSSMALAAHALQLISALQEDQETNQQAIRWVQAMSPAIEKAPAAHAYWLQLALTGTEPRKTCILVYLPEHEEIFHQLTQILYQKYRPGWLIMPHKWQEKPNVNLPDILKDKPPIDGQLTLYFCENHTCQKPLTTIEEIQAFLRK